MRYAIVLILCLSLVSLAEQNGWDSRQAPVNSSPPSTDNITLTVLDTWSPVNKALGLDYMLTAYLLGANNSDMVVQFYLLDGTPSAALPLSAGNAGCFGVARDYDYGSGNDVFYTSDWSAPNLFYTEDLGASWNTVPSPAGSNGRGMDFDGTHYWITNGTSGGLWRFQPGVSQTGISIPEVTGQPSGLTVFDYGSSFGVAVTTYNNHSIWFYEWSGSSLSFLGSAACPVACASSYGLAYDPYQEIIFWSYRDASNNYWISKLDFEISVSLQCDTWGAIKSCF